VKARCKKLHIEELCDY